MAVPRLPDTLPENFSERIQHVNGCWVWTGNKDKQGYARFYFAGHNHYAHSFSFSILKRRLTYERLKNLCKTRHCVNPDHWWVATGGWADPSDAPLIESVRKERMGEFSTQDSGFSIGDAIRSLNLQSADSTPFNWKWCYGKCEAYAYCLPREIKLETQGIFSFPKKALLVVYPLYMSKRSRSLLASYPYPEPSTFVRLKPVVEKLEKPYDAAAREYFFRGDVAVWVSHQQASATFIGHAQQLQRVIGTAGTPADFATVK